MVKMTKRAWVAVVCGVLAVAMLVDRSALGADVLRGVAALERCARARPAAGAHADLRPLTGLLLNAYLLLASALALRRSAVPGLAVRVDVPWSTALVWFQAGYFGVALVRVWDADWTCGTHPNGISGHFLYYVYYAVLFWFHVSHSIRATTAETTKGTRTSATATATTTTTKKQMYIARAVKAILELLRVGYTVCALGVLHATYAHGYHSLRQVLLGLLLSGVFAATAVLWCLRYPPRSITATDRRRRAALLLAGNALGIVCLGVLCVRGQRPTAYRELALYAVALVLALFYPAI